MLLAFFLEKEWTKGVNWFQIVSHLGSTLQNEFIDSLSPSHLMERVGGEERNQD
jgi:hypothetical protein